ncbi:PE family protein [Mycobacterium vicinigordonae]|uniref:PE-PPE domain-containing protein n=1 Tax=Mycobacterium vicinigordonae TaxID=1719132 RepID=A0A7D6I1C6_9MYCO|nr:PE-PPE domain-containing protein [Mycobacterium vicinigordonae]QLL07814.1 PE-PPE domain-containing protein [Mycobacterium vicinigordonae]
MSQLVISPESLAGAATDVDEIAAAIHAANSAAARPTSSVLAAAGDEVSAAVTALFNDFGAEYQQVVRQANAFHSEFARALAAAGTAYTQAELAANAALSNTTSLLTASGTALPAAAQNIALIMGGTGNPLPLSEYVTDIENNWIKPLFGSSWIPTKLPTPEQFWPITPDLGNMTYNQSVAKGVSLLNAAITHQAELGNNIVAFGYSQSASIINNEILALMANNSPFQGQLSFIMAAAGNNPNGGLLSRFPGFYIPILDATFNGATPANNPYPTQIFTAQYDGIAHTPQYPLNILADVNALMGYFYVHNQYPALLASNAVQLPTSPGYTGNTEYYMFMTQNLPLLQPIRDIPYAGPVIADLLQPPLRVMVDLGYNYGYADLPTPAGLINIPNPFNVAYYLGQGLLQAPYGAAVEIGVQAGWWGPEYFPDAYPWVPSTNPGLNFYFGPTLSQSPVTAVSLLSGGLGDVLHVIPPIFN